jgi:hypothetical protein
MMDPKPQHLFDVMAVQRKYLSRSDSLHRSCMLLLKHQDLLLFRERWAENLPLPCCLFSFNSTAIEEGEGESLEIGRFWNGDVDFRSTLSDSLSGLFVGASWVSDYFALSTFPSLFGGFVTEELSRSAAQFIRQLPANKMVSQQ